MTLSECFVEIALEAAASPARGELEPALLCDVAATVGTLGDLSDLIGRAITSESPSDSAFRLAAHMHARTQDDFFPEGRVHVGVTSISAALAVEAPDLLQAMAGGFAVTKILSKVYAPLAQSRGYRPTGLFATMGAATSAGIGLGLSPDELTSALGIAAAFSGGTNQSWIDGTDEWLIEVGAATRAGVDAALLAQRGAISSRNALEGASGWAKAYFDDADASMLGRFLDNPDALPSMGRIAIKPFPVSGIAQPPTMAASRLHHRLGGESPERFEVRMAPSVLSYPGSQNRGPFNSRSDSLMSVARCSALAYLHGAVPLLFLEAKPGPDEQAILDVLELIGDSGFDEGTAEVTVGVGAQNDQERCEARDILYPSLDELLGDLSGLADRSEADLDSVKRLAESVVSGSLTLSQLNLERGNRVDSK